MAYLHGKSIRERAQALIEIADPKFRNELYEYCEKTKWLQRPQTWSNEAGASLNTSLAMSTGTHRVTVQAKDSLGRYFQSTVNITVH